MVPMSQLVLFPPSVPSGPDAATRKQLDSPGAGVRVGALKRQKIKEV